MENIYILIESISMTFSCIRILNNCLEYFFFSLFGARDEPMGEASSLPLSYIPSPRILNSI
jgi:hypothetical protein